MLRQDALARLVHMRAAFHRGGSNLSDKGLNLSGSWQQGHSATYNTRRVFKSSAKDSTRARCAAVTGATGFSTKRDDQLCESAVPRTRKSRHRRIKKQRRYERLGCHKPVIPVISVLVELILGHLRYLLTDVPPQPNSPPDNVLRPDRPAEASLGSNRRGCYPASDSRIGFPLSVPVLSWLFGAGKARKSRSQSVPGRHEAVARHVSGSSSPPTVGGLNWDPEPSPQSQSFSELRIHFADFPCLHCSIDQRLFTLET
ncbi:hypothetical protein Bca4012_102686 [Brassica carinata]